MEEGDLSGEHLDVYDRGSGPWNPEHGEVDVPEGWEFLPSGDAFVTRRVKAAGRYWVAWRPRSRTVPHRRLEGLWAPAEAIAAAQRAAEDSQARRAVTRETSARSRERAEAKYRSEMKAAILVYLDFAPRHAELAQTIAEEAAFRAAVVGSGRVGRTRTIPLAERAELAARAHIRHRHTAYEQRLEQGFEARLEHLLFGIDDEDYREIKRDAHAAVDDFLEKHRQRE